MAGDHAAEESDERRPNVVVFMTDQLRHDHLGYAGNDTVETPHIDALAAGGVTCDRTYVNNPLCMPARATLFTGRRPRDHGVRTNGVSLDPEIPTLPGAFSDAGYRTHGAGKFHHSNWSLPLDDIARMLETGESSMADFPPAFRPRIERVAAELDVEVDPDDGPVAPPASEHPEAEALWKAGHVESLPEPFYGFETTDFVGAHGDGAYGEYRTWLETTHPDSFERFPRDHPDNDPGEAPGSWRWSIPAEHHYNRWIADRSRAFIEDAVGGGGRGDEGSRGGGGGEGGGGSGEVDDEPFFLFCSFPDPHHPYAAPEPYASMYDPADVSLPTRREGELDDLPPHFRDAYENEETELSGLLTAAEHSDAGLREMIAITYGMVSFVDDEVGRVLSTLEEMGVREDTLVVFCSDHGDMMGDHWMVRKGPFHFEGLLRTPMVLNWPAGLPAGRRTDGLASAVDFFPTMLDLCDVPSPYPDHPLPESLDEPPALAGESLVPQLRGDRESVREAVVVENDDDYFGQRVRTYVTERYKLTVYPGRDYGELFDLREDPDELHNRWDDPSYAEVKADLYREFLEAYIEGDAAMPRRTSHAG
jgi:arylsulfatase